MQSPAWPTLAKKIIVCNINLDLTWQRMIPTTLFDINGYRDHSYGSLLFRYIHLGLAKWL
jgi:hypothetical protein